MIGHAPHKPIAQTYDGAAALSGVRNGVQAIIKDVYPSAYFIHFYAHQFNLVLQKATSVSPKVRIFFSQFIWYSGMFFQLSAKNGCFRAHCRTSHSFTIKHTMEFSELNC